MDKDFETIIKKLKKDEYEETSMILFSYKGEITKFKIFPNSIKSVIIKNIFNKLENEYKDSKFVEYSYENKNSDAIKIISTKEVSSFYKIKKALTNVKEENKCEITVDDYNIDGNTIMFRLETMDGKKVYMFTKYKSVSSYYKNRTLFKKENGRFKEQEGTILYIPEYVDVIIYDDKCYIINEREFNFIFDFNRIIDKKIEDNKEKIKNVSFIDDGDKFYNLLINKKTYKNKIADKFFDNTFDEIAAIDGETVFNNINKYEELSNIKFNKDKKIIINDTTLGKVVKLITGEINLNIITERINGVEDNETI